MFDIHTDRLEIDSEQWMWSVSNIFSWQKKMIEIQNESNSNYLYYLLVSEEERGEVNGMGGG